MKRLYIIFHVNNFLLTHVYPSLIMNMALIMVSYSFSLTVNLTVIFCFKADILSHLHFFFFVPISSFRQQKLMQMYIVISI